MQNKEIPLSKLVDIVYAICVTFTNTELYPYQEEFAKGLLYSVLGQKGNELTGLFSRQSGKTETVSVISAGLMIALPYLSHMPMFENDSRLKMYKNGFWVGIFAPRMAQATIAYERIKSMVARGIRLMGSKDQAFNVDFSVSNGENVILSNGSRASAISAGVNTNIEGKSFMLIICDECLPAGTKVTMVDTNNNICIANIEDISVGDTVLSYNHKNNVLEAKEITNELKQELYGRKIVNFVTESGKTVTCTDNHTVWVTNQNKYVRADNLQVGDSVLSYASRKECCGIEPDDSGNYAGGWVNSLSRQEIFKKSKVCCKSLSKTDGLCVCKVSTDSELLFESTKNSPKFRLWEKFMPIYNKMLARNKVLSQFILQGWQKGNNKRNSGLYDDRGSSLLVSGRWEFQWNDDNKHTIIHDGGERNAFSLADREIWCREQYSCRFPKKSTISLFQKRCKEYISQISFALHNSKYAIQNTYNRRTSCLPCVWKKHGGAQQWGRSLPMFSGVSKDSYKAESYGAILQEKIIKIEIKAEEEVSVYDITVADNHNFFANDILVHNCQDIDDMKVSKSILPMGSAYNASLIKIGTPTIRINNFYDSIQRNIKMDEEGHRPKLHYQYDCDIASKYNDNYRKAVDKAKVIIGENSPAFRMSYKLEWFLGQGMMIDKDEFIQCNSEPFLDRIHSDLAATHSVGLDVGGAADSTVITVCEVDWTQPIVMESRVDDETGEDIVYTSYNTYVKDWYEICNVKNLEEQYEIIIDYLSNFNVKRLMIDATRERGLADRLAANLDCAVVPFIFTPKNKSDLYKYLDKEIIAGRVRFCYSQTARETVECQKFLKQMSELEKTYNGALLKVKHPTRRDSHDDYCDSLALAVYGTIYGGEEYTVEMADNKFYQKTSNDTSYYTSRNRLTAGR